MKNTNKRSGYVSAVTTKETNLKVFSNKDVAEMSIKVLEDLLDSEKGPIRPYRDEDLKNRAKAFLSKEYQSNSFEMKIDRKKGIVYAASINGSASKKEQIESDFASGKEVNSKEYCSLCKKYMKPDGSVAVSGGVTCNGIFAAAGEIPCRHFEFEQQEERAYGEVIERAIQNSPWRFSPSKNWKHSYSIVTPNEDPDGSILIADKLDSAVAEHICKIHNDWRNFRMKNGKKKVKKGNLRRLKNLAWRMKTFRQAFKLIEKNKYLGFDSIRIWIEQHEDDVNQWIFTKWLKNSSNYEDFMWYFNDKNESYFNGSTSNEYEDMQDSLVFIDYFDLTTSTRTVVGIPAGEWDSYTFHQEYESNLFADGKDFTAALVLEKMFDFAEDYVKHNGWITAEMADKYHIDLKLVETNSNSDVLLDKMDPDTANRVRKIVEKENEKISETKPLEKRVDDLEKMVRDIWQNDCADKQPAPYTETPSRGSSSSADEWNKADGVEGYNGKNKYPDEYSSLLYPESLPHEIINKKPVLEGQTCPRCRKSKEGCEFYDKGTCRGICYPTYPPQFDPCVFEK